MVIGPLDDVWWVKKPIDAASRPIYTQQDGSVGKAKLYTTNSSEIMELYDGGVFTPGLFLDDNLGNGFEEINPATAIGADEDDILDDDPPMAARMLMKRIFRFYLDEVLDLSTLDAMNLRRERPENPEAFEKNPLRLQPALERGRFKVKEWREAFIYASQSQY